MKFITSYIEIKSLDIHVLITFKCLKEPREIVLLHEIKFLKDKSKLIDHVSKNQYILFENPNDIKQEIIIKSLKLIKNYLSGENVNLYDELKRLNIEIPLKERFPTPFSNKVIHSLLDIKYGESTSYSRLGDVIGSKAYRVIGTILKNNPFPLIIPCHRVIKKNGQIGGFMGSQIDGWEVDLKNHLIKLELAYK